VAGYGPLNKTPLCSGEIKRVADAGEPPVVIPVVVVAVDVHVALVVPPVERGIALCKASPLSPPLEYSQG